MAIVPHLSDKQRQFLKYIISDFDGPTSTARLLDIIEQLLEEVSPNWEQEPSAISDNLRLDIEVCLAALDYHNMSSL